MLGSARSASSFVTTPIFYINGQPHIGHLYSALLADASARARRQQGSGTVLSTGTDEHGLKVYEAANLAGKSLDEYCSDASSLFKACFEAFDIDFDAYVRTTDSDHAETVQWLWKRLQDRGYLYEGEYRGWYCCSDEAFLTDRQVGPASAEPSDTAKGVEMVSLESGHTVEQLSEPNWMFRLSAFREPLREWLASSPDAIQPPSRRAEVMAMLEDDASFTDLSVSRPFTRVPWGIPAPPPPSTPDTKHTIYVWLDALANYLTVAGGPPAVEAASPAADEAATEEERMAAVMAQARGESPGIRWDGPPAAPCRPVQEAGGGGVGVRGASWPPSVHVVGKDIMRFHCIYWPAFLLAAGLALPQQVLIHGHFVVEGRKMSKSLGNVLDPVRLLEPTGDAGEWVPPVDSVRWALLARGCLGGDGDFSREQLESLWASHIADGVGNLAARATGRALLPVPAIPDPLHGWSEEEDGKCLTRVAALCEEAVSKFAALQMSHATCCIVDAAACLNAYFTTAAPWKMAPGKPGANAGRLAAVLFTTLEGLRLLGVAMQPAIPASAAALLDALAVPAAHRASVELWMPHMGETGPDWLQNRAGTILQLGAGDEVRDRPPLVLFSKPAPGGKQRA